MNDNDLCTAVRASVAEIHSATPVTKIIGRGRAVRARRRIRGVAGALTVGGGTALAVTMLLPSGHPALLPASHPGLASSGHPGSHPASARLAAWTVARQANGDIDVTINQLHNPAGLQSTLRADGLPVNVTFYGPGPSASCQRYSASPDVLTAVAQFNAIDGGAYLVINPSALPRGAGVSIFDEPGARVPLPSPGPGTPRYVKGPGTTPGPARPPSGIAMKGSGTGLPPSGIAVKGSGTGLPPSGIAVKGPGTGLPPAGITGPLAVGLVHVSQQCTG